MAKNISYGAKGSDVKKIQQALIKAGYSVGSSGADGSYGPATQAAVKKYQKDNGLKVDGIVGTETSSSLFGNSSNNTNKNNGKKNKNKTTKTTTTTKAPTLPTYQAYDPTKNQAYVDAVTNLEEVEAQKPEDFVYDPYVQSDAVTQAFNTANDFYNNKPVKTDFAYNQQFQDTINAILNREDFTYDLNGDALYQQYKDQYTLKGLQGMMDTMGQAQAMTGGYGNSYAQSVGQQTYQGYLQQLNDKIPELYQLALDKYNMETQNLYNQYGMLSSERDAHNQEYRDQMSDFWTEFNYLNENAWRMSEDEYNKYMNDIQMKYNIHQGEMDEWMTLYGIANDNVNNYYNAGLTEHTTGQQMGYDAVIDGFNMQNTIDQQALAQQNIDKQYAYDTAMGMLSMGVMPSNEVLKAAGIDKADAKAMVNKVNEQSASGGSSSSGGSRSTGSSGSYDNGGTTYDNGGYETSVVKQAQEFIGAEADGYWGTNSTAKAKAMGYDSIAEVIAAMDKPDPSAYSDWEAGDWESYFAQIRQSEDKAAAEEELKYFTDNGLIPKKFVSYGAIGARGSLGH